MVESVNSLLRGNPQIVLSSLEFHPVEWNFKKPFFTPGTRRYGTCKREIERPMPNVRHPFFWKSMSGIFESSYGEKLFLHIYKLEWFKSKQIWVDGNVFRVFVHKNPIGLQILIETSQHYLCTRESLTVLTLRYPVQDCSTLFFTQCNTLIHCTTPSCICTLVRSQQQQQAIGKKQHGLTLSLLCQSGRLHTVVVKHYHHLSLDHLLSSLNRKQEFKKLNLLKNTSCLRLSITQMAQMALAFARSHFRAQKSLNFHGPPILMPLVMDLARLKTISFRAI